MHINNKVVIVTGASSGIGLATARLLYSKGAKLTLAARSKDILEKLAHDLPGSLALPTDMTQPGEITQMVQATQKHFGKVDAIINSAGQGYDAPIEKTTASTVQKIFILDFLGPLIAMQQVIPLMKAQGEGSIINISSGTALMHLPNMGAYAAVKAALAHLSLTAREELKKDNIIVSVVYPYSTLTNFENNTIKEGLANIPQGNESYSPPPDNATYVAGLIIDCISSGEAEVFAHSWMRPSAPH